MLATNSQMYATSVTFMCIQLRINILRCFGYPREHNFGLVLIHYNSKWKYGLYKKVVDLYTIVKISIRSYGVV